MTATAQILVADTAVGISGARPAYRFRAGTVIALLLTGGFFFRAGSPFEQHPLAVPGLREAFLALCTLAALRHIIMRRRRREPFLGGEVLVLVLVPAAMLLSAIFAWFRFGQPIGFGLIEERRLLGFYALFLIQWSLEGSRRPFDDLVGALHWTALTGTALGLLMQQGVLGDLTARDVPFLDPRKHRIINGISVYTASAAVAIVMMIRLRDLRHAVPLGVALVGLIAIGQTRSTSMQLVAAVPLVLLALSAAGAVLVLAVGTFGLVLLLWRAAPFLGGDARTDIGEINVRLDTIGKVLRELAVNDYFGMGALSLQWQDGFHRIYDRFFYLTDVGVFGELYRYGFLLPFVYLILAAIVASYALGVRSRVARDAVALLGALIALGLVSQGWLSLVGQDFAILLAFAAADAQSPVPSGARHVAR